MQPYILNKDFSAYAVIDEYESMIWTDRYSECGDFEIYVSASLNSIATFQAGTYLCANESDRTMIIEGIELKSDPEDGDKLRIVGRSLETVLSRRIIWEPLKTSGKIQDVISKVIDENVINPEIKERAISNFIFETNPDQELDKITVDVEEYGIDIYEFIKKLCSEKKVGFKVILDRQNRFVFSMYMGMDRSYNQLKNPYVIFSPKFENIVNSNYIRTIQNYKNVALVSVSKNGSYSTFPVQKNEESLTGLDRREMFVPESSDAGKEALTQKGLEKLDDYKISELFDGEINSNDKYIYGVDYGIGDIVQIKNNYGMSSRTRVIEFVRSYSSSGSETYPSFEVVEEENQNMEENKA